MNAYAKTFVLICCLIVSYVLISSPWGEQLDRFTYDFFFRLRGPIESPKNIVVVAIDEESFDEIDLRWPWPRSLHGILIEKLFGEQVSAVAFDVLFAESSRDAEDKAFAEKIDQHENIVLVNEISLYQDQQYGYQMQKIVGPTPILDRLELEDSLDVGFANMQFEPDGFVRKFSATESGELAFSYQAAKKLKKLADFEEGETKWINFYGPSRTIPTISYYQALNPKKFLPEDYLKNKLVFIGLATASEAELNAVTSDHFPTPFSRWSGGPMPGVEIHASAAANLLNDNFIKPIEQDKAKLLAISLAIIFGAVFFYSRPTIGILMYTLVACAICVLSYYLFCFEHYYTRASTLLLPISISIVAAPLIHYFTSSRQKAFIKKAFSTYLAPELVNQLIENPDKLELGGEEREGTVMFLDLVGFTSFSEKLPPKELIELINRSLGECSKVIQSHNGMVDKYIGDCVMAVWGIPINDKEHANKACLTALKIKEKLDKLSKLEKEKSGVELKIRIGISSGKFVAGNIGGGERFDYTVLGNTVNLASRLEGVNNSYGTEIIVSKETKEQVSAEISFRELDLIRVKGQRQTVSIYELQDRSRDELNDAFERGREAYSKSRWEQAIEHFNQALKIDAEDNPSKLFITRSEEFIKQPPDSNWDGVYQMRTK